MKIFLLLIFVASASGIFISCNFYFNNWSGIGQVYNCDVTSMDFSDNSTHITGYNGTHLSGYSSTNVRMIWFLSNTCPQFNLTTIPKGFLNFFPNFISLYFESCSISSLNGDELDEYSNLQRYGHVYSNLTRVPGNFFSQTPNMKYVNFGANKIQHVGEGLLDNLQNLLLQAFFYSNICISKWALDSSQIPALIEALRQNCTDIEPKTTTEITTQVTTTISTSTTTNQPQRCEIDNFENFVCGLDEEIENLKENIKSLNSKNEVLETNVQELKEEMRNKLENQADILYQLEQMVIELYSRPCAC